MLGLGAADGAARALADRWQAAEVARAGADTVVRLVDCRCAAVDLGNDCERSEPGEQMMFGRVYFTAELRVPSGAASVSERIQVGHRAESATGSTCVLLIESKAHP